MTILWIYIALWKTVKEGAWSEGVAFEWISIRNWEIYPMLEGNKFIRSHSP